MGLFERFPYTNFHELNADWIISEVKRLAEEWKTYNTNWEQWKDDTNAAFQSLHDYVMDYFNNLDVTDEISAKINEMAQDGTLSELISPIINSMVPNIVTAWLDEHITETTPPIDNTLSVSAAAADSKIVGDAVAIGLNQGSVVSQNRFNLTKGALVGTAEDMTNVYYKRILALEKNKKYNIEISITNPGEYNIQAGTSGSAAYMVDDICGAAVKANGKIYIEGYAPTFDPISNYIFFRRDKDGGVWSITVYEYNDIHATIDNLEINGLKVKQLTVAEFNAEPYNNLLSNLDDNTIFRYATAYNGLDLPNGRNENYFIITITEGNKCQLAITRWGEIFIRNYYSGSYKEWYPVGGLYKNEIVITDTSVYASYDEFPNGSIVNVEAGAGLSNAPQGFRNIGHGTVDSGTYNAVVMTYSGRIQSTNNSRIQVAVIYSDDYTTTPITATRYGRRITGTQNFAWSEWSEISADSVLHGTNKVVDINTYQQLTFSDFNDAPPNSIFQVDLNTGSTILNNPAPGRSGVLITYNYSPTNRHATVQNYYALEGTDFNLYFRYGYWAAQDVFNFTRWKKVASEYV